MLAVLIMLTARICYHYTILKGGSAQIANNLPTALFIVSLEVLYCQQGVRWYRHELCLEGVTMNDSLKAQCIAEFLGTGLFLFLALDA